MPAPIELHSEMVMASAGSGKTFALTDRYIALLVRESEPSPESIVALTFTRKAAGEFLDGILDKLAAASASEEEARELGKRIGLGAGAKPEDFLPVLRVMLTRLHLLGLSTLDSFFARVVRAFPFEFGLSGAAQVLDERMAEIERGRVLAAVVRQAGGGRAEAAAEGFMRALSKATYGSAEVRLSDKINGFIQRYHNRFLEMPGQAVWGQPSTIWGAGAPDPPSREEMVAAGEAFIQLVEGMDLKVGPLKLFRSRVEDVLAHTPGRTIGNNLTRFLKEKLVPAWPDVLMGGAAIKAGRGHVEFGAEGCRLIEKVFGGLVAHEIAIRLRRTQGGWELMRSYEDRYGDLVRGRGRLTFGDLAWVIANGGDALGREEVAFRLDGRFDHWLLDEFQDTSRPQWGALEGWVDEVVMDPEKRRSLFVVGDTKQAIYGWRGGDVRLFGELDDRYNAELGEGEEGGLRKSELAKSFRSSPAVIEAVNLVFRDPAALATAFPEGSVARWNWDEHDSNFPGRSGYAAHLSTPESRDKDERFDLVAALIEEIDPVRNGLSCAIIMRRNKEAEELLDHLRAGGCQAPVTSESERVLSSENPATALLRSLFQAAAHPGDTAAWEHLAMSPLGRWIEGQEMDRGAVVSLVLNEIAVGGMGGAMERWVGRLEEAADGLDDFTAGRCSSAIHAGRAFDAASGVAGRDIDAFVAFFDRYKIGHSAQPGAVEIITTHKAKGLTYDVAILADLEATNIIEPQGDGPKIGFGRGPGGATDWLSELPAKVVCQMNPEFDAAYQGAADDFGYEALCGFYVAMTRPRYAVYLVTGDPEKASGKQNYHSLLKATLGAAAGAAPADREIGGQAARVLYEVGEPRWWECADLVSPEANEDDPRPPCHLPLPENPSPPSQDPLPSSPETPSSIAGAAKAAEQFEAGGDGTSAYSASSDARAYGTLVHRLLECVAWADDQGASSPPVAWAEILAEFPGTIAKRAEAEAENCLSSPDLSEVFARGPETGLRLWRELPFDVIAGGRWIGGVIDRVWAREGPDGSIEEAWLIDFKTGPSSAGAVATYAPQLDAYVAAVSSLFDLAPDQIHAGLVFTRTAEIKWQ